MNRSESIELDEEAILFEDADLVAVDKASGWLSDATRDPDRDHLGAALERWGDGPFHAAHRLDRGTSGVMLFARHADAATGLMQQFQDRSVSKSYQAVVAAPRGAHWEVGTSFERRSHLRHHKGRTEEVRSGGKVAETRFEVEALDGSRAIVRAFPRTGRTHQLRVHLAAVGAPIVGDDLYGTAWRRDPGRLWLHADRLDVRHPGTGEPLRLRSRRTLRLVDDAPVEVAAD